jgi:hypothetical protein
MLLWQDIAAKLGFLLLSPKVRRVQETFGIFEERAKKHAGLLAKPAYFKNVSELISL